MSCQLPAMSLPSAACAQLSSILSNQGLPIPSQTWLANFLSTQKPGVPPHAVATTARHRLLHSDFSFDNVLSTSTQFFPENIHNVDIQERRVIGVIPVQVLSVEDLSSSRWEQIEAIEASERGEDTKGREIIRIATVEDGEGRDMQRTPASRGPHKLVVQDVKRRRVMALELKGVPGIATNMAIGTKGGLFSGALAQLKKPVFAWALDR
jgi:RecQ-mediated genome instability protein 1